MIIFRFNNWLDTILQFSWSKTVANRIGARLPNQNNGTNAKGSTHSWNKKTEDIKYIYECEAN
mgnify:FL=1